MSTRVLGDVSEADKVWSMLSRVIRIRRRWASITSSRLVCDRLGRDGGLKAEVSEPGDVGEWKVWPLRRDMLVLRASDPSGSVAGVLRGLDIVPAGLGLVRTLRI